MTTDPGGIGTYAATLAAACLVNDGADLPQLMDQLLALSLAPGGLPLVLASLVTAGRDAITTATAGDPERAHLARWELEQRASAPTE